MPTETKSPRVTLEQAKRVLEIVDAGLVKGLGRPVPGQMCVEAAVAFAFGEPHGDGPTCVAPSVRAFKIGLNDADWSSDKARSEGMRRIAIAQLGTAGVIDESAFAKALAEQTIRKVVPAALRAAAGMIGMPKEHAAALKIAADNCEKEGSAAASDAANAAARAASYAASDASYASDAANAANAAARAASYAASDASDAANAAARAASYAARAASDASVAASYAASDASYAASYDASYAASDDASYAASDGILKLAAEAGVQALRIVGAIGVKFMDKLIP